MSPATEAAATLVRENMKPHKKNDPMTRPESREAHVSQQRFDWAAFSVPASVLTKPHKPPEPMQPPFHVNEARVSAQAIRVDRIELPAYFYDKPHKPQEPNPWIQPYSNEACLSLQDLLESGAE